MSESHVAPIISQRGVVSARVVAALVVVIALLTGVALGVALGRMLMPDWPRGWSTHRRPGMNWSAGGRAPNAVDRHAFRERFTRELDLSASQATRVDSIMEHRMAAIETLQREVRPRMKQLVDSTRAQIDSVLTPTQRERFHEMERRRMRPPSDDPPPPPE